MLLSTVIIVLKTWKYKVRDDFTNMKWGGGFESEKYSLNQGESKEKEGAG